MPSLTSLSQAAPPTPSLWASLAPRISPMPLQLPTCLRGDVDLDTEVRHGCPREGSHAQVGAIVTEVQVNELQAAGDGRQLGVVAGHQQPLGHACWLAILKPLVGDLLLGHRIHVAGQLQVLAQLYVLALFDHIRGDLEGGVLHGYRGTQREGWLGWPEALSYAHQPSFSPLKLVLLEVGDRNLLQDAVSFLCLETLLHDHEFLKLTEEKRV